VPYEDLLAHAARILPVVPSPEALDGALQNTAGTIPVGTPGHRALSLVRNRESSVLRFFLHANANDALRRGDYTRLGPSVFCFVDDVRRWVS
jgi:hypothetical protein